MNYKCRSIGCNYEISKDSDFCSQCITLTNKGEQVNSKATIKMDTYYVNQHFGIQDSSGCLQHAIRMLLLSGTVNPPQQDILEAITSLNRWLELNAS